MANIGAFRRGAIRIAAAACMALAFAGPTAASESARLMAAAVAEAAAMPGGAARARAAIAIARIQAGAGLADHARDALRQTAEAVWRATADTPSAPARLGLLAETAEAQCLLGFRPDAAEVLNVAGQGLANATVAMRVRLLRAALVCQDGAASGLFEGGLRGARAPLALAEQALPARAVAAWEKLPARERARQAPVVAEALARLGYLADARAIDPKVQDPPPAAALPELLAQADLRRRTGDAAGALAFLQIAERLAKAAPAFAPAVAAAYADAGQAAEAVRMVRAGADAPEARDAIATAYGRARDRASARRWLSGARSVAATEALARLAWLGDPDAALEARTMAEAMPKGRGRAEALAHAAVAALPRR